MSCQFVGCPAPDLLELRTVLTGRPSCCDWDAQSSSSPQKSCPPKPPNCLCSCHPSCLPIGWLAPCPLLPPTVVPVGGASARSVGGTATSTYAVCSKAYLQEPPAPGAAAAVATAAQADGPAAEGQAPGALCLHLCFFSAGVCVWAWYGCYAVHSWEQPLPCAFQSSTVRAGLLAEQISCSLCFAQQQRRRRLLSPPPMSCPRPWRWKNTGRMCRQADARTGLVFHHGFGTGHGGCTCVEVEVEHMCVGPAVHQHQQLPIRRPSRPDRRSSWQHGTAAARRTSLVRRWATASPLTARQRWDLWVGSSMGRWQQLVSGLAE